MHQLLLFPLLALSSGLLSWFLCGRLRDYLIKTRNFDAPNERSLHTHVVTRGGGWGVWLAFFIIAMAGQWLNVELFAPEHARPALLGYIFVWQLPLVEALLLLIVISWWDDKKPLPPLVRLLAHAVAVGWVLCLSPPEISFVPLLHLPLWLDRVIAGLAWVWFINLTNFMDGIDGITGAEGMHISLGWAVVYFLAFVGFSGSFGPASAPPLFYAVCVFGALAGFMVWNRHPAKLFLGDVGSIPLGFLLGYMLLMLGQQGFWGIALTLPLYYVADATLTLLKRLMRKEKVWQAHREHFYQKAALAVGHTPVLFAIISANMLLLGLCLSSLQAGPWVLVGAPVVVALLLWYLNDMATKPRP